MELLFSVLTMLSSFVNNIFFISMSFSPSTSIVPLILATLGIFPFTFIDFFPPPVNNLLNILPPVNLTLPSISHSFSLAPPFCFFSDLLCSSL